MYKSLIGLHTVFMLFFFVLVCYFLFFVCAGEGGGYSATIRLKHPKYNSFFYMNKLSAPW